MIDKMKSLENHVPVTSPQRSQANRGRWTQNSLR